MKKIGIIGLGHMGQAMINGFQKKQLTQNLIGYYYAEKKLVELNQKLKIKVTNDYAEFVPVVDLIILAVRPDDVQEVVQKLDQYHLEGKTLISIISGLSIAKLKEQFHQPVTIVRALPNLNAQVGLSATGVTFDELIAPDQKTLVLDVLQSFGRTYVIEEEIFSAFTVVGGCTPAYFFKIVGAIYQAGVKNGISDEMALDIAIQSGYGSLTTLLNSNSTPQALIDAVCVPNGITIEGIQYLDQKDFDKIINEAIAVSIAKDLKGH